MLASCIFATGCTHTTPALLSGNNKDAILATDAYWGRVEWRNFISNLSNHRLVELAIVYEAIRPNTPGVSDKGEVLDAEMALNFNSGRTAIIDNMQIQAMNAYWNRTEKAGTAFTNPGYHVEWHKLVERACFFVGVDGQEYGRQKSFESERALIKKLLADNWDRLNKEQREEVIRNSKELSSLTASQQQAIILGSGAAMIATLSTTILMNGFVFYTTMSSVICASAGALGVTLPFGAYMGASSTAALISGPVGWTVVGLAAIGTVVLAFNDPGKEKLVKIVVATHLMKAKAMEEN